MEADIDNLRLQQMEYNINNWYHTLFDGNDSINDQDVANAWKELVGLIRANHICHLGILINESWMNKPVLDKIADLRDCINHAIDLFARKDSIPLVV